MKNYGLHICRRVRTFWSRDVFGLRTFWALGRFEAWDVLKLGCFHFGAWNVLGLGCFGVGSFWGWDDLRLGTF
jgi:hypothetical protein